jgi:hypothetical protein
MEYILDVAKWRCGGHSDNALGEGSTMMLNLRGYSCCLGQFALQKGVDQEVLFGTAFPSSCGLVYDSNFVTAGIVEGDTFNTKLATKLADINDSTETTPKEKIQLIKQKLEEHGHSLKVLSEDLL